MKTSHLISDVMGTIGQSIKAKTGKVDAKTHKLIESWPGDYTLKRLIQWNWFLKDLDVGPHILSASNIAKLERTSGNLAHGRLQIGQCRNGDEIHLRERDFAVLYWSHDESEDWDRKRADEFHLVYRSVDLLLLAIRNRGYVPFDSYSGREYFQLLERVRQV